MQASNPKAPKKDVEETWQADQAKTARQELKAVIETLIPEYKKVKERRDAEAAEEKRRRKEEKDQKKRAAEAGEAGPAEATAGQAIPAQDAPAAGTDNATAHVVPETPRTSPAPANSASLGPDAVQQEDSTDSITWGEPGFATAHTQAAVAPTTDRPAPDPRPRQPNGDASRHPDAAAPIVVPDDDDDHSGHPAVDTLSAVPTKRRNREAAESGNGVQGRAPEPAYAEERKADDANPRGILDEPIFPRETKRARTGFGGTHPDGGPPSGQGEAIVRPSTDSPPVQADVLTNGLPGGVREDEDDSQPAAFLPPQQEQPQPRKKQMLDADLNPVASSTADAETKREAGSSSGRKRGQPAADTPSKRTTRNSAAKARQSLSGGGGNANDPIPVDDDDAEDAERQTGNEPLPGSEATTSKHFPAARGGFQ